MAGSLVHQILADANAAVQHANIPLLLLGTAVVAVLWRVAVIIYNLTLHPLAKIPGPRFQAAIDFPFLWQTHVAGNGVYKTAILHQQYGSVVRVGPNRIVVDGAIAWTEIFAHSSKATEFPKPKNTFFPNDHLSLINAPKERHREMRRQLSHAFSDSALMQQEETIVRYVNMLMDCLDELQAENATFNITEWLNYMTFDLIGELAFSKSFGSLESRRYHPWVLSIFQGIRGGAFRRFIKNYPFFAFICERFGLNRDVKVADRNRTAARRRADQRMQLGETIEGGKMDFMTYMMRNTRNGDPGMNADEILATSPVLVVAGSETTATTLTGLLFYLSRNPDKAEILINEIRAAYKSEDDISMRNTAALPYLHAAIEETLRIYPAAAFTTARLSPGSEVGGYYLPKGVSIYVNAWATFQNPKHFHRATEFLPERWLPASHPLHSEVFRNDNRDAFKPFSHGTRNCIGKNLAYAEMRLLASRILFRYQVQVPGQDDWKTKQRCFNIWEKGPLMVKLKKRQDTTIASF